MTDRELQKLSKLQLIELLYYLSKENDELKEENRKLQDRLDALIEKQLLIPAARAFCRSQAGIFRGQVSPSAAPLRMP